MDQQQQQIPPTLPAAPFPAPPPFWKKFTSANVEKYNDLSDEEKSHNHALPAELAYLRPPPPPTSEIENYTTFGIPQQVEVTPALPPIDQLLFDPENPETRPAVLLTRLTKSLLLNFLELMTVLSLDPTKSEEKMADIRQLVLNVHAAVNMYRPHQAREGVREMLEGMLEDGQREIEECDRMKAKIENFLVELGNSQAKEEPINGNSIQRNAHTRSNGTDDNLASEENRRLWNIIHEIGDSG